MSRLSAALLSLSLLLPSPVFTEAQELTPTEIEAVKASDKHAYELLETIAEGIPNLRTFENRIYLPAQLPICSGVKTRSGPEASSTP